MLIQMGSPEDEYPMVSGFLGELRDLWRRQHVSWRTVVTRQVFNRFFNQMTLQYSNIYIRKLGASPVELGAVNSASGLGTALISRALRYHCFKFVVWLVSGGPVVQPG
jgi:hypothetical protein